LRLYLTTLHVSSSTHLFLSNQPIISLCYECRVRHTLFCVGLDLVYLSSIRPCIIICGDLDTIVPVKLEMVFHPAICVEFDTCLFLSNEIWFICHTGVICYTGTLCFVDLLYFQVLLHLVIGSTPTDFARLQIQIFENMQKDTCRSIRL
jgi:hypothetical protein